MTDESESKDCGSVSGSGRADKGFKKMMGTLRCSRKGKQRRRLGSA